MLQFMGHKELDTTEATEHAGMPVCIYVRHEVKSLSRVQLFATLWTVAYQASPSMGFSKQEYWSGLLCPLSGDLPDPGIEPMSPALQSDSLPLSHWGSPCVSVYVCCNVKYSSDS